MTTPPSPRAVSRGLTRDGFHRDAWTPPPASARSSFTKTRVDRCRPSTGRWQRPRIRTRRHPSIWRFMTQEKGVKIQPAPRTRTRRHTRESTTRAGVVDARREGVWWWSPRARDRDRDRRERARARTRGSRAGTSRRLTTMGLKSARGSFERRCDDDGSDDERTRWNERDRIESND